ncbi:hypothetical protein [Nocardia sp. CY41]|uniref:hypothetical protein n=1 Tax=Nocardia sp. CY41 TaxID=2608686 RepID=UPI001357CB3B|nr:hypothetical protein [Nocardia sp. CY41]
MTTLPAQLRIDPLGTLDGRIVLSLIHLLRTARDDIYAGTTTLADVLDANAPILASTIAMHGLGDNLAYTLHDSMAYFLGKVAQDIVPGFAATDEPDHIDVFQLTTLPRRAAYDLLAHACGRVNATLAQF